VQLAASYINSPSVNSPILNSKASVRIKYLMYIRYLIDVQVFLLSSPVKTLLITILKSILETIKYTHFDIFSRIGLKLGNAEIEDINMPVLAIHGLKPHRRVGIQ